MTADHGSVFHKVAVLLAKGYIQPLTEETVLERTFECRKSSQHGKGVSHKDSQRPQITMDYL